MFYQEEAASGRSGVRVYNAVGRRWGSLRSPRLGRTAAVLALLASARTDGGRLALLASAGSDGGGARFAPLIPLIVVQIIANYIKTFSNKLHLQTSICNGFDRFPCQNDISKNHFATSICNGFDRCKSVNSSTN